MTDRIFRKPRPRVSKTEQRNALLEVILSNPSVMKSTCSSCQQSGAECVGSPADSDRCAECVRLNLARCDANGLSIQQLRKVAAQHSKLEAELESAEEARRILDARVERLRKQKKMWFEKMMRAVSRGIDDVEELEQVEREEAEREERHQALETPDHFPTEGLIDWSAFSSDPSLSDIFGLTAQSSSAGTGGAAGVGPSGA